MNKYQEALDYLRRIGGDGYYKKQREKSFDVLQELVDKATPMKRSETVSNAFCGNCGYAFGYNKVIEQRSLNFKHLQYCSCCGQKLDWSEDE